MAENYIPLIIGLIGAIIGAASSVVTIIVQSHFQSKREMKIKAISLALEDWKTRYEHIKDKEGVELQPLAVFINYHTNFIKLAEKGAITPEAIKLLSKQNDELIAALKENRDET